ncbi:FadR/GntR family transcriptional regulator [Leucobacter sp. 1207-22]|uniref:FadR/GntR family transcriptional regulator n=1 Tax=Leucobacter sp. 1207-22 TaxID=2604456 RepID=UPI004063D3D1
MDWTNISRATTLSLPDRLSVDIERLILDGKLAPGDRLPPERELAEHLGVSRVSIREALRELENRGLIDRKPGRGTIVLSPGEQSPMAESIGTAVNAAEAEIRDIMELRAILEPPIARLTAGRAKSRDVAQLRELVEAMEKETSNERYAELDRAFHQTIAQYTHNPLLALINEQLAQQIAPSRAKRYQTSERRNASSRAHRLIFEAIEAGNGEAAEQAARDHVLDIAHQIALAGREE